MTAVYTDTPSLPSAGNEYPMLSRLRMLHRRGFGDGAWTADRHTRVALPAGPTSCSGPLRSRRPGTLGLLARH